MTERTRPGIPSFSPQLRREHPPRCIFRVRVSGLRRGMRLPYETVGVWAVSNGERSTSWWKQSQRCRWLAANSEGARPGVKGIPPFKGGAVWSDQEWPNQMVDAQNEYHVILYNHKYLISYIISNNTFIIIYLWIFLYTSSFFLIYIYIYTMQLQMDIRIPHGWPEESEPAFQVNEAHAQLSRMEATAAADTSRAVALFLNGRISRCEKSNPFESCP